MNFFRVVALVCLLLALAVPLAASESVPLAWQDLAFSRYEPGSEKGAWILADASDLALVPPTLRLRAREALSGLGPRESLLFLSAGRRSTGGYRVVVTDVSCDGSKALVLWAVQGPPPGAMVTQALTYPMALVRLPVPPSSVELQEDQAPCD